MGLRKKKLVAVVIVPGTSKIMFGKMMLRTVFKQSAI
jgi:hypothetical protein